jgi:hypothetical protein
MAKKAKRNDVTEGPDLKKMIAAASGMAKKLAVAGLDNEALNAAAAQAKALAKALAEQVTEDI